MTTAAPSSAPARPSLLRIYLSLGRISNLPTVWTNVVAATALSGGHFEFVPVVAGALSVSSLYVGGMFLNDAFDRDIDREQRPERPIAQGWVSAFHVFAVGCLLLALGWLGMGAAAYVDGARPGATLIATTLLVAAIVTYDAWHKENPIAPLLMGSCRGLVYVAQALACGGVLGVPLWLGAVGVLSYTVGITVVARNETRVARISVLAFVPLFVPLGIVAWLGKDQLSAPLVLSALLLLAWFRYCLAPLVQRSRPGVWTVVRLIAGMSLLDACYAAGTLGFIAPALGAVALSATLLLQRIARGS